MKILYVCNNYNLVESLYDRVNNIDNEYIFVNEPPFIEDNKIIHGLIDNNPLSIWKFIIQNNIFEDEDSICVMEYDEYFLKNIDYLNKIYSKYDIISFQETPNVSFYENTNQNNLQLYLNEHSLEIPEKWFPSMFHCIKRNLIHEFVNFYNYTCSELDDFYSKYYPSKVFSCYSKKWNNYVIKSQYALCYDSSNLNNSTSELIESINYYSPRTEIICCSSHDASMEYWKPYIIYKVIVELEHPSTLLYIGNNYRFDEDCQTIYENLSFIKAWNSNTLIEPKYLNMILNDVQQLNNVNLLKTDLILFETTEQTIKIVKQWLDLSEHFSKQSIIKDIPNYVDILFSILLKIYTS